MAAPVRKVRVTVLGSGDAFGTAGRLQSSYLIQGEKTTLLVDCGPSILAALKRQGIDTAEIDCVIISHLHGDHFGGLPFLFLEYSYENPRRRPLSIAGPPGLEERTRTIFGALYREAAARGLPFPVEFRVLAPGRADNLDSAQVRAFRVLHQTACDSFGLRLGIDGRTILYSGDAAWSEDFVVESRGTDLFLCECVLFETRTHVHMNYRDLSRHAPRLGCKRLVLTHLGAEMIARRDEVAIECADDGTVLLL